MPATACCCLPAIPPAPLPPAPCLPALPACLPEVLLPTCLPCSLSHYLAAPRKLVAAAIAVEQFAELVSQFGGAKESLRWAELKERIQVEKGKNVPLK